MESNKEYRIPNTFKFGEPHPERSPEKTKGIDDVIIRTSNTISQILDRLASASAKPTQSADAAEKWAAALLDAAETWKILISVRDRG